MKNNFAYDFYQFALTIDIVDTHIRDEIRSLLRKFFEKKLKIEFFELLLHQKINNKDGLRTEWCSYNGEGESKTIYKTGKGNKKYCGQTAFVWEKGKPMWIQETSGKKLSSTDASYVDVWSGTTDIPTYWLYDKNTIDSKTSIIIPLKKQNGKVFGVLNLESSTIIETSKAIKKDLLLIGESLTIIIELYNKNECSTSNTKKSIENIEEKLKKYTDLKKYSIFIASPSNADERISGIILEVIDKFKDTLDPIYWKNINSSGNVNRQIIKSISESSFGICYFSEKTTDGGYKDNPNVLFEAGMLHALTNDPSTSPIAWIPIREDSHKIPFDFASERILIVPRLADKKINEDMFKSELESRISSIIESFK